MKLRRAASSGTPRIARPARLALVAAPLIIAAAVLHAAQPGNESEGAIDVTLAIGGWQPLYDRCMERGTGQMGDASICVRDLVRSAAAAGDIGPALSMLRSSVENDPDMLGRCHNEAHLVGEYTIALGMTIEEAYQVPWSDCRFGYYHGVAAAHTSSMDLEELRFALDGLCSPFGDHTSPATQECVHVVGHFVFQRSGDRLLDAAAVCQDYREVTLESRCLDGVMMEAADSVRQLIGEEPPDPARRTAIWGDSFEEHVALILEVCENDRPGEVRYVCYTNLPQALVVLHGRQFERYGLMCADLPAPWYQPCFEGIAAAGFGVLEWDPTLIAEACQSTDHPGTAHCISSMAFTFGIQDPTSRAESVCLLARERERSACEDGLHAGRAARGSMEDWGQAGGDLYR